jgi:hypothetical protein
MTGTNCDLFTHKSSRSYLNHLVLNGIEHNSRRLILQTGVRAYKLKLKSEDGLSKTAT